MPRWWGGCGPTWPPCAVASRRTRSCVPPPEPELTELWPYLAVFAVALASTAVITPVCRLAALKLGIVDHPKDRGVHEKTTPYLGGVAMLVGLLAALWVAGRLHAFHDASV